MIDKKSGPARPICLTLLLFALLAVGCSPLRLLGPNQLLLSHIELEGVKQADTERLQALYRQKPNSRFPLPKLAIYQLGHSFYNSGRIERKLDSTRAEYSRRILAARPDSAKVGRLLTRRERQTRRLQLVLDKGNAIMRLGEPPVVYDTALTRQTAGQLATFLRSKGFFRSRVSYSDTLADRRFSLGRLFGGPDSLHRRRVVVTYRITENAPFRYSQLDYDIADSVVAQRVLASQSASLLHVGEQYDEELIGQERARIETLLKNEGYFDFRQQYITLEADTSFAPTTVRLRTIVASPGPGLLHPRYTIRRVRFVTDAGTIRFGQKRDTLIQDSTLFLAFKHQISPRLLNRKVAIDAGDYYSLTATQTTQRQLSQLDVFRFANVNYQKVRPVTLEDSLHRQLDANIAASPAKRYQETVEFGGTYVAGLPGPFGNLRIKARNPFGGAEVLELGLRAGLEGQYNRASNSDNNLDPILTTQLGVNVNLILPQFLVLWRTNRFLTKYNPRTRFNVGYNYVYRPEYTRTNLEGTFDYIWQRNPYHQYVFTPVDLSLVSVPKRQQSFIDALRKQFPDNPSILVAFRSQFIPSLSFTSLYNSNDFNETKNAIYFRWFVEVGGITRPLYQNVFDKPNKPDSTEIQVFDFYKLNADFRRYYKLGARSFFVYRLNGGVIQPLRKSKDTDASAIPYDKYFFAGGSNSVRAWGPRRLGTGSAPVFNTVAGEQVRNYNIEQPGELLLEGNIEYRFPLFSFINGALFTDFGNVWTLQRVGQPEARFDVNRFYREFAVGSGFGLRFDFTFLILRLDIATKVYDPAAPGSKWAIRNIESFNRNQTALNLGIGYPF
ncbi:BamA/TamA family outer membrane protein [Hymenobacter sp. YC55]|uniref:translocation and assembly module lipoprotein TamL n=1 Tax=Hymenobacter sp. YC55 TaxID=3034019 RepID=UPI0023F8DC06|nr:BamA/TamA family outer membrane protein [Hymenobacter sp. YC55]MDF7811673.1 BamA/TamA family outer membrane protein [Hymenobacter sp. YC55]